MISDKVADNLIEENGAGLHCPPLDTASLHVIICTWLKSYFPLSKLSTDSSKLVIGRLSC